MSEQELKVQHKQEVEQAGEATKPGKFFLPAVDIYETDQEVTVIAEMPGVAAGGIEVTLEDDVLTIKGRKEAEEHPNARILLQEYEPGSYLRRFTVAETIDQERIKATLNNGLLKVVLPKTEPAKPRKIEVQIT
ncbi:MAG: Hsp20/alpha crystallin family protein [Desulfobulbaceae bacterium]